MKSLKRSRQRSSHSFAKGWSKSQFLFELIINETRFTILSSPLPAPTDHFERLDPLTIASS